MGKKNALWIGLILCVIMFVPNKMNHVKAVLVLDPEVSEASEGCTMFGVRGTYYTDGLAALARINEIRKEACDAGNVPDPRNKTRMLTSSDYVPVKWSKDLESVARIRAAEGGFAHELFGSGHNRLNGKARSTVVYNGMSSYGECLAYNDGTSLISGINQWYGEKEDWVNQNLAKTTGHYTHIIDPSITYIGLGDFYTEAAYYPNTLAGAFSTTSAVLDSSFLPAYNDIGQKLEIKNSYIDGYYLEGLTTMYTDETESLTPRVRLMQNSKTVSLWLVEEVTFSSSVPSVASVDNDGLVTAKKCGNVTISVSRGNTILATLDIVVKCNHEKELKSIKQPTCTELGEKRYQCDVCASEVTESIDMLPHSYEYGDADSEGYCVGVCSGCGTSIRIKPPTSYTLLWRNSVTTEGTYYWSIRPEDNPENSVISCWISDINGDADYQDMILTSSDELILSIKAKPLYTDVYDMEIKGTGIVTVDIYPLYNPKIGQTFTFRVGNQGAVDMEKVAVSLPETTYIYTGAAHTPQPVVTYRDSRLLSGTDYTYSYENNTEAGTATIKLTGKGLFSGTVSKTFEIKPISLNSATATLEAVAYEYDGTSKTPEVIVNLGAKRLIKDTDYEVEYKDNVEIGKALAVVKGIHDYTGELELEFEIGHKSHTLGEKVVENVLVADCVNDGGHDEVVYCQVCHEEVSRVKKTEAALGHDWDEGAIVKEPAMFEDGIMRYSCKRCDVTKDTIIPAEGVVVSFENAEIILLQDKAVFDGKEKKPSIEKVMVDGKEISASYYTVTYESNIAVGTGFVVISGIEPCVGTKKVSFEIYCEHDVVEDKAVSPTITETGLTAGSHCGICGIIIEEQKIIPATGKTEEDDPLGSGGNTENSETPGSGNNTENSETPGSGGNTENGEPSGTGVDAGNVDKPGMDNNVEDNKKPGTSGDTGSSDKNEALRTGTEVRTANGTVFVITASKDGAHEVEYTKPSNNKGTKVSIPDTVTINTVTYKVTSIDDGAFKGNKKLTKVTIGKNVKKIGKTAFKNCKKLRQIRIKSSKLNVIGSQAFKGIDKKAVFKVPKKKLSAYKKLITKKAGYKKTMKIKK